MGKNIYWSILFLILIGCKGSEQLVYQDLSFLYEVDSPVLKTKSLVSKSDDSLKLFLSITKRPNLNSFDEFLERYRISGRIASHYSEGNVVTLDSIPTKVFNQWESEKEMVLGFSLPVRNIQDIFFISFYDRKKDQVRLLDIGQIYRKDSPEKVVLLKNQKGIPVTNTFINSQDTFKIFSEAGLNDISFSLYKSSFSPALPPGKKGRYPDPGKIKPDSTGTLTLDSSTHFPEECLVVFSINEVIPGCFPFLVQNGSFPELSTAQDLVDPLIYIAKPQEMRKLRSSDNPKAEVDNFWLNIGRSLDISRELVEHYYSRVEHANRFFTTYKEGWKTDKGMIFIIFGRPDAVNRFGDYEEWHYEHLLKKDFYTFTFRKQPLFLSNDNYQLERKEEHEKVWYPMVDKWRKGIIIKNSK